MASKKVTRTAETIAEYRRKVASFKRSTAVRLGIDNPPWIAVVEDLIAAKTLYKDASWKFYRWAFIAEMEDLVASGTQPGDLDAAITRLREVTAAGALKKSTRTSATKAKELPACDREAIFAELRRSRSPLAAVLIHFITATTAAGLRPIEWRLASIEPPTDGAEFKLIVQNAKRTNGRAHGPVRTLTWLEISAEAKESIEFIVSWARTSAAEVDLAGLLKTLQALLRRIDRKLWPRRKQHFVLYSCRHAFAAVAKIHYLPEEVAALMGHGSDDTATMHYARPPRGSGAPLDKLLANLPEPNPAEVEMVRRVQERKRDKLKVTATRRKRQEPVGADSLGPAHDLGLCAVDDFPVPPARAGTVGPSVESEKLRKEQEDRQARVIEGILESVDRIRQRNGGPAQNLYIPSNPKSRR